MIHINTNFLPDPAGVYIVGGTVRDLLLGVEPQDYDIVTVHNPEELADRMAAAAGVRAVKLGKPGLSSYRVVCPDRIYDISQAVGGSIGSDLLRRDFTVNALAVSAETGSIIDKVNGIDDIRQKKIRMICRQNLVDDPLRMLRAFRLAAVFDFSIDPDTADAISNHAFRIRQSAGERIRDELVKLFSTARAHEWLLKMDQSGLLEEILPETRALKGCMQNRHHRYDVFDHTLTAFAELEKWIHAAPISAPGHQPEWVSDIGGRTVALKFALLLHDLGKPACRSVDADGHVHFYGHEVAGADMAATVASRLRFSARDRDYLHLIIRHHLRPLFLFTAKQKQELSPKAVTRFFMRLHPYVPDLLLHALADAAAKGTQTSDSGFAEFAQFLADEYQGGFKTRAADPPLISGHDLSRLFHLPPSPLFSKILSEVEAGRLSGNLIDRESALDFVEKLLKDL